MYSDGMGNKIYTAHDGILFSVFLSMVFRPHELHT